MNYKAQTDKELKELLKWYYEQSKDRKDEIKEKNEELRAMKELCEELRDESMKIEIELRERKS